MSEEKCPIYHDPKYGPIRLKRGVPFVQRFTKIAFNPTLEEKKRYDKILRELENPSLSPEQRAQLLAEREEIYQQAQRPQEFVSSVRVEREDRTWTTEELLRVAEEHGNYGIPIDSE